MTPPPQGVGIHISYIPGHLEGNTFWVLPSSCVFCTDSKAGGTRLPERGRFVLRRQWGWLRLNGPSPL